jgi:hypothetical protein
MDLINNAISQQRQPRSWTRKLSKEEFAAFLDLAAAYSDGRITNKSACYRACKDAFGKTCPSFSAWRTAFNDAIAKSKAKNAKTKSDR